MPGAARDRQAKMLKLLAPALVLAALTACVPAPSPAAPAPLSPSAQRGLTFARVNCAGCHAVEGSAASPNAEAPAFAAIANTPDLTGETLRQYLRDSHNYPEAMNFRVDARRVEFEPDSVVGIEGLGEASIDELGWEIFHRMLAVASGVALAQAFTPEQYKLGADTYGRHCAACFCPTRRWVSESS